MDQARANYFLGVQREDFGVDTIVWTIMQSFMIAHLCVWQLYFDRLCQCSFRACVDASVDSEGYFYY